ncbi:hypothetical protein HMPREF1564_2397 [Providencia alcalifaciens R90-1475]|uniref:Uncharacterized protein n=1 Tax=Providencia alcalifaciens DSM 30120 TaxID=520999 RepID=B6XDE4_9GAMM|nr:hypothetical protein PROVALCAL_01367 [Providencia alcalifaciens DSM 30120]EUD05580.1 hypothetical protein HMPREF1564_2397 [Providencia alcalifaciens R90-1475]
MKPVGLPWYTSAINFRKFYVTIFTKQFFNFAQMLSEHCLSFKST